MRTDEEKAATKERAKERAKTRAEEKRKLAIEAAAAKAAERQMAPDEIKAARAALGVTQTELADALELEGIFGKDTVRNWERGKRPISGPARVAVRLMLEAKDAKGPALSKADRATILDALEIAAAAGDGVTRRLASVGSAAFADTFVAAERFRKLRAKLEGAAL
jgi:DNA-binding transcriptional regulator YiaG